METTRSACSYRSGRRAKVVDAVSDKVVKQCVFKSDMWSRFGFTVSRTEKEEKVTDTQ